jgi:hypothetical protein
MRRGVLVLLIATCWGLGSAWGQELEDPQIFICQGCTSPAGGDPNPITNPFAFDVGVAGNHALASPLLLIVGVPEGGSAPTISYDGNTIGPGSTSEYWGWAGSSSPVTFNSSSPDACVAVGLQFGSKGDNGTGCASETYGNWTGVLLGSKPASYSLYVYVLPVALSPANSPITIGLNGATLGTYVIAFSCEYNSSTSCTPNGNVGSTPFTNAALDEVPTRVPEPMTAALVTTGLLGLAGFARKRRLIAS